MPRAQAVVRRWPTACQPCTAAFCLLTFAFCLLPLTGCAFGGENVISGSTLFEERFVTGETGNWLTETDEQGQTLVTDESLVIQINAPQTVQYSALQEPLFDDFVLEVDVTQLAGSLSSSYGVLFRMQGPSQFYRFEITGNGLYVVEKLTGSGEWVRFTDEWEAAPAVLQGLDQTNKLRVEAAGSTFAFYVNNQKLTEISDGSYPRGQIALDAGTFNQPGLRVAFDNVVVKKP